jgi:hypothetical protein
MGFHYSVMGHVVELHVVLTAVVSYAHHFSLG